MTSILAEIHNLFLFFQMLVYVGCFTGLILVPVIVIGYELTTKRRT